MHTYVLLLIQQNNRSIIQQIVGLLRSGEHVIKQMHLPLVRLLYSSIPLSQGLVLQLLFCVNH